MSDTVTTAYSAALAAMRRTGPQASARAWPRCWARRPRLANGSAL